MAFIPQNVDDDDDEITVEIREFSPSHFLFQIESFSLLSENGIDKYESTKFCAGDYKWKLIFYPSGKESGNDEDDVAVYLTVVDTNFLPSRWEINAVFSIFLYNQKSDNFFLRRGRARRFHAVKTEWGFPNFISKQSLIDPSNGFIVDDKCIIGAEVFVIKSQGVIERLSLLKVGLPYERTWNIPDFSQSAIELVSERFLVGDYYWQIMLYPIGVEDAEDCSISIFVYLVDSVLLPLRKVKASITVKIEDQINGEHSIGRGSNWFASCDEYYGFSEFMSISDMHDPMRGYLVEDCCILKVEISVQAVAHNQNT